MPRFVLEIGTEEIPPRFFPVALPQLRADGTAMLRRARLGHGDVKVYGTPRRLVLVVEGMAPRQAPSTREERGPAARVAFDAKGRPTQAAEGFARRNGVPVGSLVVKETDQGEYVYAVIREPEALAREAVAPLLPDLISGLSFPKTMRWGTGSLRFGRPIRWLLALVDDEVVEFELGGLRADRLTRGHPVLAEGMYPVSHASDYEQELEARSVIVNPAERRSLIGQLVASKAQSKQARVVDGGLLEETTYLLEHPTAAVGHFNADFLRLPRPVLAEEMRHVQKYFPLENEGGELLPSFIAVRDGGDDHITTVVRGWENVLQAKLIDASYFYQQDLKTKLSDRVEALQGVVFQEGLGTMYDKTNRIRGIAGDLADQAGLQAEAKAALDRAALLCKADLTTEMVAELSDLQGVMGREYALASGESSEVAEAIGEHYRPRFAGDDIPATQLGRVLAIADKVDTIAAYIAIGIMPTGSADPYGLRREGTGVIRIMREEEFHVSTRHLVRVALDALYRQVEISRPEEEVVGEAMGFLRQRLAALLRDEEVRYDLVDAALAVGIDDIATAAERAGALERLAARKDFLPTVVATTRVINISEDFEGGEVDSSLLQEEAERTLWDAYQQALREAETADLMELFVLLGHLREPIDRFFDEVLVMHEDEALRRNRLALCWNINQLFRRLADFSLVVQS